jgi:hypothetical protein
MKRDDEDLEAYWEQRAMMDSLDDGDPWEVYQNGSDDSDDPDDEVLVDDDDEDYFDEDSLEWDNPDEDY